MKFQKIKFIIVVILIAIFVGIKKECENKRYLKISNEKYTNIIPISKGKSILEKNGEYFYADILAIEKLKYTDLKKISENYIQGKKDGENIIIGLNKKNIEEIKLPKIDEIVSISEERYVLLKKNEMEFYYDLLDKRRIGGRYIQLGEFSEGKALFSRDEKIGFINNRGEEIIKNRFEAASEFQNGYAIVMTATTEKYRYIDEDGVESSDEYDYIKAFKNKVLVLKKKNKNILMNNGKYLETESEIVSLNDEYYLFKSKEINEIFSVKTNEVVENIKGQYLGVTGNEVVIKDEKDYTIYNFQERRKSRIEGELQIELYRQDYFTGRKDEKVYIYDKRGKRISKGFDIIQPKVRGLYLVGEESGYGVVNENGKKVLDSEYDYIELMDNYIVIEGEGKKSLLDRNGKK